MYVCILTHVWSTTQHCNVSRAPEYYICTIFICIQFLNQSVLVSFSIFGWTGVGHTVE